MSIENIVILRDQIACKQEGLINNYYMGRRILIVVLWFVLFMLMLNVSLSMISTSNSIENVIGFLILVATTFISIKTRCLTTIKFRKND